MKYDTPPQAQHQRQHHMGRVAHSNPRSHLRLLDAAPPPQVGLEFGPFFLPKPTTAPVQDAFGLAWICVCRHRQCCSALLGTNILSNYLPLFAFTALLTRYSRETH